MQMGNLGNTLQQGPPCAELPASCPLCAAMAAGPWVVTGDPRDGDCGDGKLTESGESASPSTVHTSSGEGYPTSQPYISASQYKHVEVKFNVFVKPGLTDRAWNV